MGISCLALSCSKKKKNPKHKQPVRNRNGLGTLPGMFRGSKLVKGASVWLPYPSMALHYLSRLLLLLLLQDLVLYLCPISRVDFQQHTWYQVPVTSICRMPNDESARTTSMGVDCRQAEMTVSCSEHTRHTPENERNEYYHAKINQCVSVMLEDELVFLEKFTETSWRGGCRTRRRKPAARAHRKFNHEKLKLICSRQTRLSE